MKINMVYSLTPYCFTCEAKKIIYNLIIQLKYLATVTKYIDN